VNQLNMCTERSLKSHVLFLDLSVANCSSPSMTPLRRSSKLGTDVCIEVTSVTSSFNALLISFSLADCYVLKAQNFIFYLLTNTFSSHDLFPPPFPSHDFIT